MPVPDPRIYLLHILDCCERLSECAVLRDEGGVPSHILLDAVCRNLEVIGKASRKIGTEMNELRNVLIHNYEGADPTLVWGIVDREIPTVLGAVRTEAWDLLRNHTEWYALQARRFGRKAAA
jgi:uncharacterized protein with HEPN domain